MDVAQDYLTAIVTAIFNAPRSLQIEIGPSEIGSPCARRLGYKLLDMKENDQRPNWKATVGTGVHLWLAGAFDADNLRVAHDGRERWLVETRVSVGEVNGVEVTGSADLYDLWTNTVVDHKTCGPTRLKAYRKSGPGQQYRAQAQLYGRGFARLGYPVQRVMVVFLPRQGELDDAYIWHEPYDEQIAIDALTRLTGVHIAVTELGWKALAVLPTYDAFCTYCPFFRHKSTDLTKGCPGDTHSAVHKTRPEQFEGLI